MNISFPKHTVSVVAKYACTCGHKFSRKNSDWFTMSPFNTQTESECYDEIYEQQSNLTRLCPKCKSKCQPLKSDK